MEERQKSKYLRRNLQETKINKVLSQESKEEKCDQTMYLQPNKKNNHSLIIEQI